MSGYREGTLCWYCERPGTSACPWDKQFDPVPGWDAQPTTVLVQKIVDGECRGVLEPSFHVRACPLFLPTGDRPEMDNE